MWHSTNSTMMPARKTDGTNCQPYSFHHFRYKQYPLVGWILILFLCTLWGLALRALWGTTLSANPCMYVEHALLFGNFSSPRLELLNPCTLSEWLPACSINPFPSRLSEEAVSLHLLPRPGNPKRLPGSFIRRCTISDTGEPFEIGFSCEEIFHVMS